MSLFHSSAAARRGCRLFGEGLSQINNTPQALNATIAARRELLESLLRQEGLETVRGIRPRPNRGYFPLSFAQERIWFLHQIAPGSAAYNMSMAVGLDGELKIREIERSCEAVIHRHASLRACFPEVDGAIQQSIVEPTRVPLGLIDLTGLAHREQDAALRAAVAIHSRCPFDITSGPLIRLELVKLRNSRYVLLLNLHHIVADGWSLQIIVRELAEFYGALAAGKPVEAPPLPIQYADYAHWQRQRAQQEKIESGREFWRRKLLDAPRSLDLPAGKSAEGVISNSAATYNLAFRREVVENLNRYCKTNRVTQFTVLLSVFSVLLHRYTSQVDFVIGTSVSNRERKELEGLVGPCMENLPLRIDMSGDPRVSELIARVRETCLEAYAYQELPLTEIVRAIRPEDDAPVFQAMFELEHVFVPPAIPGVRVTMMAADAATAKMDLDVVVSVAGPSMSLRWYYNVSRFGRDTIEALAAHFDRLLKAALNNADTPVSRLQLLDEAEQDRILAYSSGPAFPRAAGSLREMLRTDLASADSVALACKEVRISYGELSARAARVSEMLLDRGISPEQLVGVVADRSIEFWVAMIGILNAGCVYLPIDPKLPAARLAQMLTESACSAILVGGQYHSKLNQAREGAGQTGNIAVLPLEPVDPAANSRLCLLPPIWPESLAYAIFTSGSTGAPKLAMVQHRGLVNHLRAKIAELALAPEDIVAQSASQSFDISLWQTLAPLAAGAQVEVFDDETSSDPMLMVDRLRTAGVTILEIVPMIAAQLLEELRRRGPHAAQRLRKLIVTGEAVPAEFCREWLTAFPNIPLINAYGPTECSDDVSHSHIATPPPSRDLSVPIGKPIANTRLYVLDASLALCPFGVPGDLYVGGAAVGRGYWRAPSLTAEKFLPDLYSGSLGERMYRTGDKAKWRRSGELEFLGRADFQVKLRGFRIELGEIEAALVSHPGVLGAAAALVQRGGAGGPRLAGYVVPRPGASHSVKDLRQFLEGRLPPWMIPSAFVFLSALPLSSNGKVDRRALPEPSFGAGNASLRAFQTPTEELLAQIWREVLAQQRIPPDGNFFELGGHSLLATQVASRIRKVFRVELPLRAIFDAPTVMGLARRIDEIQKGEEASHDPIRPAPRDCDLPLSSAQQRLWFLDQWHRSGIYNMPFALRLEGELNLSALRAGLAGVAQRHEILRTVFVATGRGPLQVVKTGGDLQVPVIDLRDLEPLARETEARRLTGSEAGRTFDLSQAPAVRAALMRFDQREHILLLTLHHIVCDEWSMEVLVKEAALLYEASCKGYPSPLEPLPIQYADYAVWERGPERRAEIERQMDYWRTQLQGMRRLDLTSRRSTPRRSQGGREHFWLSKELMDRVRALSKARGVTLFMTLLAAFKALLAHRAGEEDIAVGTDVAGRTRLELEGLIGFFVNQLVMRTNLGQDPTFAELLQRVRRVALDAYAHQDVPFERIVQELRPRREADQNPLYGVKLVLQNTPGEDLVLSGLKCTQLGTSVATARFDLAIVIDDSELRSSGTLAYNSDLYDGAEARSLVFDYTSVLEQVTSDPGKHLSELEFRSEESSAVAPESASVQDLAVPIEL